MSYTLKILCEKCLIRKDHKEFLDRSTRGRGKLNPHCYTCRELVYISKKAKEDFQEIKQLMRGAPKEINEIIISYALNMKKQAIFLVNKAKLTRSISGIRQNSFEYIFCLLERAIFQFFFDKNHYDKIYGYNCSIIQYCRSASGNNPKIAIKKLYKLLDKFRKDLTPFYMSIKFEPAPLFIPTPRQFFRITSKPYYKKQHFIIPKFCACHRRFNIYSLCRDLLHSLTRLFKKHKVAGYNYQYANQIEALGKNNTKIHMSLPDYIERIADHLFINICDPQDCTFHPRRA